MGGTGSIVLGGASNTIGTASSGGDSGTLTIGPGITIEGQDGTIGNSSLPLINEGTIAANVSGGRISISGAGWSNSGTLEAENGGTLYLNGTWTNSGTLQASTGGTLNLNGTWTNSGAVTAGSGSSMYLGGTFSLGAGSSFGGTGTLELTGTLDNVGTTLDLNSTGLSWYLDGGTISGGTIDVTNGATLVGTTSGGTLSGVTLDGTLDLATNFGAGVGITDGLTLGGTIDLGSADGSTEDAIYFVGAQTLSGTGSIVLGGALGNMINTASSGGTSGTLTIGPGITINGSSGSIGYDPNGTETPLINQGTVAADVSGGRISVSAPTEQFLGHSGSQWRSLSLEGSGTNTNSIEVANGGSLSLEGSWTNTNSIEVASGSVLNLDGSGLPSRQLLPERIWLRPNYRRDNHRHWRGHCSQLRAGRRHTDLCRRPDDHRRVRPQRWDARRLRQPDDHLRARHERRDAR